MPSRLLQPNTSNTSVISGICIATTAVLFSCGFTKIRLILYAMLTLTHLPEFSNEFGSVFSTLKFSAQKNVLTGLKKNVFWTFKFGEGKNLLIGLKNTFFGRSNLVLHVPVPKKRVLDVL